MNETKVDVIINRVKNHSVFSVLISIGIIIITLYAFTDALKGIALTVNELIGPPTPVDVSGKWVSGKTEKSTPVYFEFKVINNKLYGTVWLTATYFMQSGVGVMSDGKIIGNKISFTTHHEYVKVFGRYNFETNQMTQDETAIFIAHFEGEVINDEIHLVRQYPSGIDEIIARKTDDFTVNPFTTFSVKSIEGVGDK